MRRPRWHKVLTDLWGNRVRSLLVVASITVGLFAIGVISTIYAVISSDMQTGYAAVNPANITILSQPFDKDFLDHLRHQEGVRQVEGARLQSLRLEASPDNWITISLAAYPDLNDLPVNRLRLLSGVWPPRDHEIVIENSKLPKTNAKLGDEVTLQLGTEKIRQLKLVGIVMDQSLGASGNSGGFFNAPVQGYVTQATLDWLGLAQPYLLNTSYLTVAGDSQDTQRIDAISKTLYDDMENKGVEVTSISVRSSTDHPNRDLVDAIVGVLFVLGLLVVFLSGFLITNTLQALLEQQVQQIGIMKTVGARRSQITGIYMVFILILGLLAFLIAFPLANWISFLLLNFLAGLMNIVIQGQRIVPSVMILQGLLALIVPQAAAFLPIWQGARISVQEAISGLRQNGLQVSGWFDRRLARIRQLSRPMRISLRNAFRRKGRLALTLLTLTMGGAVFIATFNVQVSMKKYIAQISQYFLADVNITLDRAYRIDEVTQALSVLPGIGHVEAWSGARSEIILPDGSVGDSVRLLAPPANSPLVVPIMLKGRWIMPGDQNAIVLNEQFMSSYPHLKVGDTLRLRVNGDDYDWVVVGFYQLGGKLSGFVAYTDFDYLVKLIGQPNHAALYRIVASRPGLKPAAQEDLSRQIEAQLQSKGISISDISTGSALSQTASDGFNVLTAFLLFMAVLTALVGSIGLTGTMSMNVLERTREIGVMRAIGASNRILMKMVIVEGVIIGMISWLLGSLLAFPISKIMSDSITQAIFDSPSSFGFTYIGFLIWLVVVSLLSVLASVMPARNAARLTIREVLAYE
jgi:putative ABC transport system permease protein